jgi:acyl dehydratase
MAMSKIISVDEIEDYIGYEPPPTEWFEVTQEKIDTFADVTLDHQFIHVDPEKAAETPLGTTIAHGFLVLSMLAHFAEQYSIRIENMVMGLNYGFDKVRFLAPVKVGARIRARARLEDITKKPGGRFLIRHLVTIEIKGEEKPALIADSLGMHTIPEERGYPEQ